MSNFERIHAAQRKVEILVKELFNDDKLGVRLRMEGLVVSNFDVPEAGVASVWEGLKEIPAHPHNLTTTDMLTMRNRAFWPCNRQAHLNFSSGRGITFDMPITETPVLSVA